MSPRKQEEAQPAVRARQPTGLYVHLPFCRSRCAYCTFVSDQGLDRLARTVAATRREVAFLGRRNRRHLASLYLGGGTPSLVPDDLLAGLLAEVFRGFRMGDGAEVTLEANPEDTTPARVLLWRSLGVTRVSVGVQAFSDRILGLLGRRHSARQALGAVTSVLQGGLVCSLDLILGLPEVTSAELEASLAQALSLRPHHISVYCLEMDKPHQLARRAARLPELFPDDDAVARQYLAAGRALVGAGYRHYEISNFARDGFVGRHNLRYWLGLPVLAAGLAAHGRSGRRRWANVDDLAGYLAAMEARISPRAFSTRLSKEEALRERVMLGLRLARGLEVSELEQCVRVAPELAGRLEDFLALGLARRWAGRIRLTPRGWLVSNELLWTLC